MTLLGNLPIPYILVMIRWITLYITKKHKLRYWLRDVCYIRPRCSWVTGMAFLNIFTWASHNFYSHSHSFCTNIKTLILKLNFLIVLLVPSNQIYYSIISIWRKIGHTRERALLILIWLMSIKHLRNTFFTNKLLKHQSSNDRLNLFQSKSIEFVT